MYYIVKIVPDTLASRFARQCPGKLFEGLRIETIGDQSAKNYFNEHHETSEGEENNTRGTDSFSKLCSSKELRLELQRDAMVDWWRKCETAKGKRRDRSQLHSQLMSINSLSSEFFQQAHVDIDAIDTEVKLQGQEEDTVKDNMDRETELSASAFDLLLKQWERLHAQFDLNGDGGIGAVHARARICCPALVAGHGDLALVSAQTMLLEKITAATTAHVCRFNAATRGAFGAVVLSLSPARACSRTMLQLRRITCCS